jgi:hypothetical protein
MSAATAPYLSPSERAERAEFLNRLGVGPSARRKPLGLAPIGDDEGNARPAEFSFHFADGKDKAFVDAPLSFAWLFYYLDLVGDALITAHNQTVDQIKVKFDGVEAKLAEAQVPLRNEIGSLRNENVALKNEIDALRLQIERSVTKPAARRAVAKAKQA